MQNVSAILCHPHPVRKGQEVSIKEAGAKCLLCPLISASCWHTHTHMHNHLLSRHPWEIQETMPIPADVPEAQASCKHHEMY